MAISNYYPTAYYQEFTESSDTIAFGDFAPNKGFPNDVFFATKEKAEKPIQFTYLNNIYQLSACSPYGSYYNRLMDYKKPNSEFTAFQTFNYNYLSYGSDFECRIVAVNVLSLNGKPYDYENSVKIFGTAFYYIFVPQSMRDFFKLTDLKPESFKFHNNIIRISEKEVNRLGLKPINTKFPLDSTLNGEDVYLLYNFGQYLNSFTAGAYDLFKYEIEGVPLFQLVFGSGFFLALGWIIVKFITPF